MGRRATSEIHLFDTYVQSTLAVVPAAYGFSRRSAFVKRGIDVVAGTILSLLTAPLVIVIAAISTIEFRAQPIFVQRRVGQDGGRFTIVKIRTLPTDTDPELDKYDVSRSVRSWFPRSVRWLHLDELPQLWLVAVGRMSLVGPRPEMPWLDAQFSHEHRCARAPFRPGCTGLWQISVESPRLMKEAPAFDIFYGSHASLSLDLWILWQTLRVYCGAPKVGLGDVPERLTVIR